ncbi:nuclear transport factor 2 family protein [Ralstonia sp. Ralssp110]|uniref:nuclear transport factor 2 family protein n=1 Tax=Ralstonia sp. Ralssp110 TaxID=3243004 RepID=UPI0039B5AAB6
MMLRTSKDIVMDAWRAFASRDAARIADCFTADAQWLAPEGNATAIALDCTHHMIGRDAIVHFLTVAFPKLFVADVLVELSGLHADGETVIVEEHMQATLANGRRYDNAYCFVFMLEGERIARVREYMDTRRGWTCIFGKEERV